MTDVTDFKMILSGAKSMSTGQARWLVDHYYTVQDYRIRAAGQVRSAGDEPSEVPGYFLVEAKRAEGEAKLALDHWARDVPIIKWARAQVGIGPVIGAGLLAHIDFDRLQTAGQLWRYAGLDPSAVWGKGEKRPHNARLKVLCAFKLGESFVKVSGKENAYYGQAYAVRKAQEVERNESGANGEAAAKVLETKRLGKDTDAFRHYTAGHLPPAHVHARARRWTVKLFLAHLFEVSYQLRTGEQAPKPYVISQMGHAHYLGPPPPELDEL